MVLGGAALVFERMKYVESEAYVGAEQYLAKVCGKTEAAIFSRLLNLSALAEWALGSGAVLY